MTKELRIATGNAGCAEKNGGFAVNGISEIVGKTWSVPIFFIKLMLVGLAVLRINEVCSILFRLSGIQARFSLAPLFVLLFCVTDAFAAAGVTAATGGAAISADTNGANGTGVYAALTGPTLFEGVTADIGAGTITLTAPAGFNFSTTANSVTATVTCFAGTGLNTLVGAGPGAATQTVTPTSTAITITVFRATGGTRRCALTWSGIRVRPVAGTPLASGNITSSGTSAISGVTAGTTNFGTLNEVAGAANKLAFLQQPTDAERTVVIAPSLTVQVQDQYGNLRTASTPNITLAIATNPAGGTLAGTVTRAAVAGVATFNNLSINNAGTGYTLAAASAGLTGATSSAFNIGLTVANFLVEASAGGNIGAQTAGAPFTIKITARDASNATVTAFNRAVTLTSSGILSGAPITTANFTSGVLVSQSVTILNTGTFTLTATKITGGTQFGTSNSFVVTAGPFVKLQLLVPGETAAPGTASGKTGTPNAQTQGVPFVVTVNAVDANWNVASSADTIGITSSDASARLPVDAALSSGTNNYSVTLMTVGTSTITASDMTTPAILPSTSPAITLGIDNPNTNTARRFNAFEPGSPGVLGNIRTKISGATITLDLIAVNNAGTGIQNYNNTDHTVELMDSSDNTGTDILGNGCLSSWTSIQTLTITAVFAAGRLSNFTFTYPEARRNVRIRISRGGRSGCSNDNFAIRPNTFAGLNVSDATRLAAGTANNLNNVDLATATPVHNAGRPFTISATARNAAISPATTTLYTGTPTAVLTQCAGTACTSAFGTFTMGTGTAVAGVISSSTATYSDVGSFRLQLQDTTFADVDWSDGSTTVDRHVLSPVINVGRFVPDHFVLSAPVLTNRSNIVNCNTTGSITAGSASLIVASAAGYKVGDTIIVRGAATAGADLTTTITAIASSIFTLNTIAATTVANATTYKPIAATYEGEALAVTFTLTAENGLAIPATTTNYKTTGGLATLDGTTITNFGFGAVDQADATPPTGAMALTSRLVLGISSGTWISGVGTFTANLMLSRPASPDGPYESFNLGIAPIDADGVILNSYDMASVPAGAADRKLVGTTRIRHGRLKINNTHGSELLDLPVSVAAQYWNGSSYVTNIDDSCTSIAQTDFTSPLTYVPPLKFTTTLLGGGRLSSGTGQIMLTKPTGFSGKGSVDVSSGSAISPFLPGTGRQTFGIYKGGPVIYIREIY